MLSSIFTTPHIPVMVPAIQMLQMKHLPNKESKETDGYQTNTIILLKIVLCKRLNIGTV